MHLEIRYVTRFVYPSPVWDSHNTLRARPRTGEHQTATHYSVEVTPAARIHSHVDHWGTHVDSFGVRAPHDELVVDVRTGVDTLPRPVPEPGIPFDAVREQGFREHNWVFLHPTRHTRWDTDIASVAAETVAGSAGVTEAVEAVVGEVHRRLDYRPGATRVGVDVTEVWGRRAGVCQDFAHLGVAMLRAVGIPARYVSGYFYAADPSVGSSPEGDEITVQTHAWLEAAVPGFGWWAHDPANGLPAGERHVTIGHGRDYDDVTPLRGVYVGDSEHELGVQVIMGFDRVNVTRLPAVELEAVQQQ